MKGYGFVAFSKNISKTLIKNLSENISQKVFDHVKKSTADAIKTTSKKKKIFKKQLKQLVIWLVITSKI